MTTGTLCGCLSPVALCRTDGLTGDRKTHTAEEKREQVLRTSQDRTGRNQSATFKHSVLCFVVGWDPM